MKLDEHNKRLDYESPQAFAVELKTDACILQASKPNYLDGGDLEWEG
jgi:hypothetical protein